MLLKTFIKQIQRKSNINATKNLVILALIFLFFEVDETSTFPQVGRDCFYNGRRYPHGTIIGDYQCIDGRWVRIR